MNKKLTNQHKTVLVCPLNWGLGHASRDIPIIKFLLKHKYKVIIGADKEPLRLLLSEFPNLNYVKFPAPQIKYSRNEVMAFKMFLLLPKLVWGIFREHFLLNSIVKEHNVDIVISDNRYGLWNKNIHTIFITHQLAIQTPTYLNFLKGVINKINHYFINKYNQCWVPDVEGSESLTGELSHINRIFENVRYIGLLSRFEDISFSKFCTDYEILVILSGPEPQYSIFKHILEKQIFKTQKKCLFVLGKPGKAIKYSDKNIDYVHHLDSVKMAQYIKSVPYVISRAGYTSIMDYISLKKLAILVPTPGQTEQEYLACRMKKKGWFYSVEQSNFNLPLALDECNKYSIDNLRFNNCNELILDL